MRRLLVFVVVLSAGFSLLAQQTDLKKMREQVQKRVTTTLETLCKMLDIKEFRDVPADVLTRQKLEEFMLKKFKEESRPGELEKTSRVMMKFGVWKKEWDLKKMMIAMLRKNVAGLYSPKDKKFFVMTGLVNDQMQLPMVVAHELTHALQDQQFDLWAFERSIYANDDRSLAAHALIEGQATLIGVEYMNFVRAGKMGIEQGRRISPMLRFSFALQRRQMMKTTPRILCETLLFPYEAGTRFYEEFCLKLGVKRSAYLFLWPPLSTEQILHPEKYLDPEKRDEPTEIRLLDPAEECLSKGNYETCGVGVLGEFLMKVVMSHFIDETDATRAAEGWDGDRYFVVTHKPTKRDILFWLSTWDTENDAKEFFDLYIKVLEKKHKKTAWRKGNTACFWIDASQKTLAWIERNGSDVVVIESATKKEAEKLLAFAANASKVTVKRDLFKVEKHPLRIPEIPKQSTPPKQVPQEGKEGDF